MDTDFLVGRPLREVMQKLDDGHDIVTYWDVENIPSAECGKYFSSNFMAGRKNNAFSRTWYDNIKMKLTNVCEPGTFQKEKVCCHVQGEEHSECHIPWASMEHMKDPTESPTALLQVGSINSAEAEARAKISLIAPEFITKLPEGLKMYCYSGNESMTPHLNGEVYWQHWSMPHGQTAQGKQDSPYDGRFACDSQAKNLSCTKGNWGDNNRTMDNFFGRIAYHLFFSTGVQHVQSEDEVLQKSWLLSDMYRRSLGMVEKSDMKRGHVLPPFSVIQQEIQKEQDAELDESKFPYQRTMWAYFDYPDGPDPFVQLNMMSWHRQAPEMRVVLVNNSNARRLIPDLPEEFFRLGDHRGKADVLREGLLFHHGGLYIDTHVLMNKPVKEILAKLDEHEVVSDSNVKDASGACSPQQASANYMAGRKGNRLSTAKWDHIKAKLTRKCTREAWTANQLCCHVDGETAEEAVSNCRMPWATEEQAKAPALIQTATEQSRSSTGLDLTPEVADGLPTDLRVYCYSGPDNSVPHVGGEMLWQPFANGKTQDAVLLGERHRNNDEVVLYDTRFMCSGSDLDLACTSGTWGNENRTTQNFFGRPAYHLVPNQQNRWEKTMKTKMDVLNMDWLVSDLYRRALGLA